MASINYWEAIKSEAPAPSAGEQGLVRFGPLGLEPRAEYQDGDKKVLYTFDQAQASVTSRGLHLPTFREVMAHVIVPGIEGSLTDEQLLVFKDMFRSYGEWFDNAFHLKDGMLYVSTGIGGLRWDTQARQYDASNMTVGEQPREYAAHNIVSGWNRLKRVAQVAPTLVVDLYGRSFDDLPARVQQDAGFYFPRKDVVCPVSRGNGVISLDASTDYHIWAARGVQKNFHRK